MNIEITIRDNFQTWAEGNLKCLEIVNRIKRKFEYSVIEIKTNKRVRNPVIKIDDIKLDKDSEEYKQIFEVIKDIV